MCGLIAAWAPSGLADAPLAAALADLRHRGPDAQLAQWRGEHCIYLGHARLKIIDTSDDANQPFISPCRRWAMVFNGEIYNYQALRVEIGDRWQWRTRSDTEVLLAAWSLWGIASLDRFVGMFAFAIHDAVADTLTLARDRFGIKPLYHIQCGEKRVFASEIPPLLRFLPRVESDQASIRTYLELGLYDHGERTFFKGVQAIQPGSVLEINLRTGVEHSRRWYRLVDHVADLSGGTERDLVERAEALVFQAVQSHLVADVPVGLNVSGGVDSSMLTRAAISQLGAAHLFTQDFAGYSEANWVREIAAGGTLHIVELSFTKIDRLLEPVTRIQAEPFGGVTVCGYDALYATACEQGVTVLLDGNGVDEAFLGYERYHQEWAWAADDARELARRTDEYRQFWGRAPVRPNIEGGIAIDGSKATCVEAIHPDLLTSTERLLPPDSLGFDCDIKNMAAADLLYKKIPRGLRFNDRMSMARSRELRVPFLDHRLVEFAYGVPTHLHLGSHGTKALFRKVAARHVPESVAFSPKRSVQSPQREWIADGWRGRVEELLRTKKFADLGWVEPAAAQDAWTRYLKGPRENSFFIWQWLNLDLWAKAYLDR